MPATQSTASLIESVLDRIDGLPCCEPDLRASEDMIVDALACMLGSSRHGAVDAVSLWSRTQPRSASMIAIRLGAASNVLELDAMHVASSIHPGTVVVPAAMALAWEVDASPGDLARAVLHGTEAAVALGRSTGLRHRERFQSTSTCGAFGAALACARLYGLDRRHTVSAMGLGLSTAGGLWSFIDESCDAKPWHAANAASTGVLCTQLARAGLSGPTRVLESPRGFLRVLCENADVDALLLRASNGWAMHEVAYKPWPAPRPAHAAIGAALQARGRHCVEAIARIEVRTFAFAVDLFDRPQVDNEHDARFSLQYLVAVALEAGRIGLQSFSDWKREPVRQLMQRVDVVSDARMSERYPAQSCAAVKLSLVDGSSFEYAADAAPGDPLSPLSRDQWEAKWAMLLGDAAATTMDALRAMFGGSGTGPGGLRRRVDRLLDEVPGP